MNRRITPRPLAGQIRAIPSKSEAHRLLICAALADKESRVELEKSNQDIDATARALRALGAGIVKTDGGFAVKPIEKKTAGQVTVDCGESGSTLRFLLPVAAACGIESKFAGSGRLPARPMQLLCDALRGGGCCVSGDFLPISVSGTLSAGNYSLPGNVSSQYVSGLLFALPLLEGESEILLTAPLESTGYVEMTLRALERFGITVLPTAQGWRIPGRQRYIAPASSYAAGDWSNAAFWLSAFALGGGGSMTGLEFDSAQGDRTHTEILTQMGAKISRNGDTVAVEAGLGSGDLTIDARNIPDLVPVLAVTAAGRNGTTRFCGCGRLRLKESDRIASVCAMLEALGGRVREADDEILVEGIGSLTGGTVDATGDHRIAMAAAVASVLCKEPVTVVGAEAVAKSYPTFFEDFEALGGCSNVI